MFLLVFLSEFDSFDHENIMHGNVSFTKNDEEEVICLFKNLPIY